MSENQNCGRTGCTDAAEYVARYKSLKGPSHPDKEIPVCDDHVTDHEHLPDEKIQRLTTENKEKPDQ